jgi:hypothetical protein
MNKCEERCVGAKCQRIGPHRTHVAVVPYIHDEEGSGKQKMVQLKWPVKGRKLQIAVKE